MNSEKITSLIIGRAGSSFRNKNILTVHGRPLVQWTALAASSSKNVGRKFISSDSWDILNSVKDLDYEPIHRPDFLATDKARGCDVVAHAIQVMSDQFNHVPDYVLLQHANSPTILNTWIDDCFRTILTNKSASAVVPVLVEMDKHPFRQKRFLENGKLESFFPNIKGISSNRQELPRSAVLAHNFWLIRTQGGKLPVGEEPWTCLGSNVFGYQVEASFDVHNQEDLQNAEEWLVRNYPT